MSDRKQTGTTYQVSMGTEVPQVEGERLHTAGITVAENGKTHCNRIEVYGSVETSRELRDHVMEALKNSKNGFNTERLITAATNGNKDIFDALDRIIGATQKTRQELEEEFNRATLRENTLRDLKTDLARLKRVHS